MAQGHPWAIVHNIYDQEVCYERHYIMPSPPAASGRSVNRGAVSYTHLDVYKRQALMEDGKILQYGTPEQMFCHPGTKKVAE